MKFPDNPGKTAKMTILQLCTSTGRSFFSLRTEKLSIWQYGVYGKNFAQAGLILPLIFGFPAPKLPNQVFPLVQSFLPGSENRRI
jgi:hypothetical protein